ncbi:septum formation family protein [Nocardioides immobilis]|nr:septum formation family protein [Nocardioides immobilis]
MSETPDNGLTPPGPSTYGPAQPPTPAPPANPYFGAPPRQAPRPSTDGGLGWTAFGLAVVFCFPLLPLVGAVLAIITLARKRFRPRWIAILALLAGLAGTGLQVAVVTSGAFWDGVRDGMNESLEDEAEDARRSGEPTEISSLKLRTGDCFNDPVVLGTLGPGSGGSSTVTLIPCDQKHDLEVYATFRVPGTDFPGKDAFGEHIDKCFGAFRRYVGVSYGDSVLEIFYYSPTKQSWSVLGDRTISCLAAHSKRKLTESVKGSKR